MRSSPFFTVILLLCTLSSARAQTSYPMITHVTPVAVQRGKKTEVLLEGQMNFRGVYQVLIEGKGIKAEVVASAGTPKGAATPPVVRSVKLRLDVAADAPLGVREFRVASNLGISTLGQIIVVADPVLLESGDNNTFAKATKIPIPSVACGRIEALEDVDCYRFSAKAGQTFTFEVYGARIEDKIHDLQKHADPLISLLDSTGRELAANDDAQFADPLLTYTFARDGDYIIRIRDAKYDGDPRWVYALLVTDQPRAAQIYPFAFNPGKQQEVEPVGSAKKATEKSRIEAPTSEGIHTVPLLVGKTECNPVTCVITPLPLTTEQEPNDEPSKANLLTIPSGVNGRIGTKRDLDHFRFQGTKGKAISFEVVARRFGTVLNSQLDSTIDILSLQGAVLATNDDAKAKDAALVFTPTADSEYILRLRDVNNKGGDGFVYFLAARWAAPDFTLKCDPSKAMIGPGSRAAWFVHVNRVNGFTGPVKVEVTGLPSGVTASSLTVPPTMTQGVVVLSANEDATKPIAANIDVTGNAEIPGTDGKPITITRRATAVEEIYFPGGGRGRLDVRMQSVAVTDPTDILDVQVKPDRLMLKPGEEIKLDVTITRRKDYDKPVSIDILLRHLGTVYGNPLPPGVTIVEGKSKTLLGTGNQGSIVLKVDPKAAPIEDVPICILAHVSINFVVKVSYASPVIRLSIGK